MSSLENKKPLIDDEEEFSEWLIAREECIKEAERR